jgi:Ca-activated chloride channel homolog
MQRKLFRRSLAVLVTTIAAFVVFASQDKHHAGGTAAAQGQETPGSLQVLDEKGAPRALCPLKHTDVKVEISGALSRVNVTQEFANPFPEKIEAVYVFPLPANAAVDDMTMIVGERTVRGKVLRREEAQAVYDAAKAGGQVASLLDQERPNIFTQSVANILPGEEVKITISYVETLKYEAGSYEFSFPMVVGPRYLPGPNTRETAHGPAAGTEVPDAARISPKLAPAGMRSGHDVSLDIMLDAGVPLAGIKGKSHEVEFERLSAHTAHVRLKNNSLIPNQDFVLKYEVAGKNIQDALLAHRSEQGGYFSLMLQPPDRIVTEDVTPKELVFVLDTSGSMGGFPIEKAKESMKLALDGLYPGDTFNLITFAGDTRILFPGPVPATPANLRKAQAFLAASEGSGGTEMMKAIKASLDASDSQDHVRIVCFMTDGYVGNDMEIIAEVQKHPNARVFAFGIGSSVNRFLLDKMAEQGRGEVEYVALNDDGSAAAQRFHERVRNPLLTDISVDWNGLPVSDVYPQRIPDLFGSKPVVLTGRYTAAGHGVIRLKGKMAGREFVRELAVDLPESETQHNVLASLWARARIDDLMGHDYNGMQRGEMKPELREAITSLGLEYRLLTQFTSFVAVEEMIVTDGGQPRRIDVPVDVPAGLNRDLMIDAELRPSGTLQSPTMNLSAFSISGVAANRVLNGKVVGTRAERTKSPQATGVGGGGVLNAPPPMARGVVAAEVDEPVKALSPAEQRRQELRAKLHPSIMAVVDRLHNKTAVSADEVKFIRDGKAEIQIWLTDKSPETLAQLKALGFEVVLDPKSARLLIGRLPLEKLEALVELKFIRYVAAHARE